MINAFRRWALAGVTVMLGSILSACQTSYPVKLSVPETAIREKASHTPESLWKVPIGGAVIEDITAVGDQGLLLTLRERETTPGNQEIVFLDTDRGQVRWRRRLDAHKGRVAPIMVTRKRILLQLSTEPATSYLALATDTGARSWSTPNLEGVVTASILPEAGTVLISLAGDAGIRLCAYDIQKGELRWERRYDRNGDERLPPAPRAGARDLFVFYRGVERLDGRDGTIRWQRDSPRLGTNSPPPRISGRSVYMVDRDGVFHDLDVRSGKSSWSTRVYAREFQVTNIFPLNERVYLRGKNTGAANRPFRLQGHSRQDGRRLWHYDSHKPLISNLIEHEKRVYGATPKGIMSFGVERGGRYFSNTVTNSGRTYPVRLRRFGNRVVFLGELVIAGVEADTGRTLYRHGFDPIELGLSLTSLDGHIEALRERRKKVSSRDDTLLNASLFAAAQVQRYQNLSNHYSDVASQKFRQSMRASGLEAKLAYGEAQSARIQASMNDSFAQVQRSIAMHTAAFALGNELRRMMRARNLKRTLERQRFRRRIITSAYGKMDSGPYAYRPNRQYVSSERQFLRVSVVHLPTGKMEHTILAPSHGPFGLWTLLDTEKGTVYHNTIGLDPGDYRRSEAAASGGANYLETFLIAQPARMPE